MIRDVAPLFTSQPVRDQWTQALEQVAMLGSFDPISLVGSPEDGTAIEILTALGKECVEVLSEGLPRWQLNPDSRRRVLHKLWDDGRLESVATSAEPNDSFGRYLVDSVLGRLTIPEQASLGELDVIHSAIQFAATVGSKDDQLAAIERAVASGERREAIRSLLPRGLIGRDHYLRRLRRFVEEPRGGELPILMISGTGGVGKSALLAEFVRRSRRRLGDGVPIIWLDFDRAVLAETDPTALTLEFARQLGLVIPALAARTADFRAATESRHDADIRGYFESATGRFVRQSVDWSDWNSHGLAQALRDRTIVLVLDTLEEILVHDDGRGEEVIRWIRGLATEGGATELRAILSGRTEDRFTGWAEGMKAPHISLGDLGPKSAVRLLERHLKGSQFPIEQLPGRELVEHYGGNPLTLNVLGLYLGEEGPKAAQRLLEDAGNRIFNVHFAQHYLYKRILGRIRSDDPDLIKIAHPGLVLRRVSPELIKQVLAKPCGLRDITSDRAEKLFRDLAAQIWLVEPAGTPMTIRHRRDLRRLIFGSMNEAEGDKAHKIHKAAAEFYSAHRDHYLSSAEQDVEALYHRVFAEPSLELDDETLRLLASELGQDSADLPARYRARLKIASGKGLEADELDTLTVEDRVEAEILRERGTRSRGGNSAEDRRPSANAIANPSVEAERAFAAADIEHLAWIRQNVLDEFVDAVLLGHWRSRRMPPDLTDFAIWRVSLAVMGTSNERGFATEIIDRVENLLRQVEWSRPLNPNRKQSISLAQAIQAIILLLGSNPPNMLRDYHERWFDDAPTDTTEALRVRQLARHDGATARGGRRARVSLTLLRYLSAEFARPEDTLVRNDLVIPSHARDVLNSIHRGPSHRHTLSDLEAGRTRQAYVEAGPAAFANPATASRLRGISPELYPLVQAAAQSAPNDALRAFIHEAELSVRLWPRELTTQPFAASLQRDSSRWTGTLIETADRFGLLGKLLDYLAQENSNRGSGHQVARLVRFYGRRLRS
ncbi:ATP-binding protein [Novosphingobium sp. YJ-S2-02]|uniref:ATP-binding protein n=1 Tax=Novosphingobium aureum TaxID=2792964 RepID=A0A931MJE2_9SPHN|nr:ATP-binding protein [Novosphingobium aureum]MBH0111623.1 ATP-binding protein [Novosphingobium aureum]